MRVSISGYLTRLYSNPDLTNTSLVIFLIPQLLAGDFNSDGIINSLDYSLMNSHWFTNYPSTDINKDGLVNSLDFSLLSRNWFKTGE
jgi:hypothetical protein